MINKSLKKVNKIVISKVGLENETRYHERRTNNELKVIHD